LHECNLAGVGGAEFIVRADSEYTTAVAYESSAYAVERAIADQQTLVRRDVRRLED
jgi:hypothetical protein